jgi:hypothetical protein
VAYRNKTYIAFDGDNDMRYYLLMKAWKASDSHEFDFHNAHDLNTARDSSQEESIKRQLRVRFANTRIFIILIGTNTWRLTKFVEWEIETAVRLNLPIIAVNLNGNRKNDSLCPPSLRNQLAVFVPFKQKIIEHAMDNWPSEHLEASRKGNGGAHWYPDHLYATLKIF